MADLVHDMRRVPGVQNVHDLHVWSIASGMRALSCHALIDDLPPSQSAAILQSLEAMLREKYQIGHTAVQFECDPHIEQCCCVDGLYCQMEKNAEEHHHIDGHIHEQTPVVRKGRD